MFSIDTSNGCCGAGPWGMVSLTANGPGEVDVTVSLLNSNQFVWGGQAGAFAFNLDLPASDISISVSAASVAAGFSGLVVGNGTQTQHMANFGNFDYAITGDANHTNGDSQPIGPVLTFAVVDSQGIATSDFNVYSSNGTAAFFSGDIFAPGVDATGIVGTADPSSVVPSTATPEPGTLMLSGAALVALGLLKRKQA